MPSYGHFVVMVVEYDVLFLTFAVLLFMFFTFLTSVITQPFFALIVTFLFSSVWLVTKTFFFFRVESTLFPSTLNDDIGQTYFTVNLWESFTPLTTQEIVVLPVRSP